MIYQSALSLAVLVSSLATTTYDYTVLNAPTSPEVVVNEVSVIKEVWGDDSHIGLAIAQCESGIKQKINGVIVRNPVTPDVGTFQINIDYHLDNAISQGMNVYTTEGNVLYAKYLFDKNGTRDWSASSKCWKKLLNVS